MRDARLVSRTMIAVLVGLHLTVSVFHGNAHTGLAVALSAAQTLFVYGVILLAPLVAAALVWTRYVAAGVWTFFVSMTAALLFGLYYHYVAISPDNVAHLPEGTPHLQTTFTVTAAALAALELTSALYGAACLRRMLRRDK